jgi:hypothetical protein
LKSSELGVIEFDKKYPIQLYKCLSKYYNIKDTYIRFYFPYIEYFSQEDKLIDYDSRFNNIYSLVDILESSKIIDENNIKFTGVVNKNNSEFSTEIVIKHMPILNFENIMLLKKHLKTKKNNILMPSQPLVPFGKLSSFYNSAYIETMVSYITSKLIEKNICPHFPYFYGYCIFNENDTLYNITDDIDKLDGYSWFTENETSKFYKKYGYELLYKPGFNTREFDCDSECDSKCDSKCDSECDSKCDSECDSECDNECDSYNSESDIQTYAIVNNSPVQLKFSEYCGKDNIDGRIKFTEKEWESILFQVIYTLYVTWSYFKLTHNDLHLGNILFKPTNDTYLYYKIEGKLYKIPTYGYIVKIIDWNRSTFCINGTYFKNECFDRDGECYGQFIFPENYYYCKNVILPSENSDLALLASSIIDEGNIDKDTKIYELVKGWCTNKYGVCVPHKYSKFDMYKESSKCKNSNPKNLFNSPVFSQYRINENIISSNILVYDILRE